MRWGGVSITSSDGLISARFVGGGKGAGGVEGWIGGRRVWEGCGRCGFGCGG